MGTNTELWNNDDVTPDTTSPAPFIIFGEYLSIMDIGRYSIMLSAPTGFNALVMIPSSSLGGNIFSDK